MLGHLVAVDHAAHGHADLVLPRKTAGIDAGLDRTQRLLGGTEQLLALMAPQLGKLGVATGHEPLPGIVGMGDLG